MDRSFSITSTGSGAIRQYHQQQHQHFQSVHTNSISPSCVPHHQYNPHLCRITSTSPTNIVKTAAAFNSAFGVDSGSLPQGGFTFTQDIGSNIQFQGRGIGHQHGSGTVTGFFRVPSNLPVQQTQPPIHQQQQQYYHQIQQTSPNNFLPVSGNNASSGNVETYGQNNGGSYCRIGSDQNQSGHHQIRNSRNNCGQQLERTSANTRHQQAPPPPPPNNFGGSNNSSTVSGYSIASSAGHQDKIQQVTNRPPQQQVQVQHTAHQKQVSSGSMPNNQQHHQANQNMNKNRYGSQTTSPQQASVNNVVVAQCPPESIPSANVKQLLIQQQISHTQSQQPHKNEMHKETSSSAPHGQVQQQAPPQYRIFKRGDSIPGISSPIPILSNPPPPSAASVGVTGDNGNSQPPQTNLNTVNISDSKTGKITNGSTENDTANNGGSDKENSNLQSGALAQSNGRAGDGTSSGARTPLSQVGEIARFHNVTVSYRLVKETGPPHAPTFTVLLQLGGEEYTGEGPSIKKAQHAAATEALEKTALSKPPPKSKPKKPYNVGGGGSKRPNWALIQLTNVAQELQLNLQFVQQPVPITDPFRRGDPPSIVSVHVGERIFTGEGVNFNVAKNTAVMVALKAMLKVKQEADLAKLVQVGTDAEQSMMEADNKSPISIVHEMAMKRGLAVTFSIVQEKGPPHMKVFTVSCKVGEELETEGQGPTKQAAKKASSELMIAKLKEIPITLPATSQGVNLKAMQRGLLRQKTQKKKTSTPVLKDLEKQAVSPISRLIQISHIKKFKEPEFTLISTGTENNVENFLKQITERDRRMLRKKKPIFTIEVTVGPHTCQGTGPNKKAAKKAAAEAAIIALGYGPTDDPSSEDTTDSTEQSVPVPVSSSGSSNSGRQDGSKSKVKSEGKSASSPTPKLKLAGAKQIAPGVIVLKREPSADAATSAAAAQEMKRVSSVMTPCPAASSREGIDKLAYLSKLLEISVSYSDFPKKNEYLSVVSLTTNPPHVAHGCGTTLEEAQNAAALKILEELSTKGLDSVTAAAENPSE